MAGRKELKRQEAHSLIIGVDFSRGPDHDVLIVAKGKNGVVMNVVNAFQGEEARELYARLVTPKNKEGKFDESLS